MHRQLLYAIRQRKKQKISKRAKKSFFALPDEFSNWHWNVTWWSDPVLLGKYPEEGLAKYEPYLPKITEEDMAPDLTADRYIWTEYI